MNEWPPSVWSQLRMTLRGLRRAPGFAAAVVAILLLGLGANATMFTVIDRLLLSAPHHVESPESLRTFYIHRTERDGSQITSGTLTWQDVLDLETVPAFSSVAAWSGGNVLTLGDGEAAEKVNAVIASWRLFPMLGVSAARGRFFGEEDDRRGAAGTMVLSEEFWRRRFGSNPEIIGQVLHVGDGSYEVIGIAPEGFTGADLWPVDVWLPLWPAGIREAGEDWPESRRWWWLQAAGRLAAGITVEVATEQATAAHQLGRAAMASYDANARVVLAPIVSARGPNATSDAAISRWLGGVSLAVLLIACANVANLVLARAIQRRRELAVRLALGSSTGRLITTFVMEGVVLSGFAAVGAVAVGVVAGRALHATLIPNVAFGTLLSARLVGFTLIAAAVAVVLSGLLPAVHASRSVVMPALNESSGRTTAHRASHLRLGLVIMQTALSTILLSGAGLFVASLRGARHLDLGFDAHHALFLSIERTESQSPSVSTADLLAQIEEQIPRIPGVRLAARASNVPMGITFVIPVNVPGWDSVPRLPSGPPTIGAVAPDFFTAMGQPIVSGRAFLPRDQAESAEPVAIVNETLADFVWPGRDPLTRCVRIGGESAPCARIVGVARTHTTQHFGEEPRMAVWQPVGKGIGVRGVVVRTDGPAHEKIDEIRSAVTALSPSIRFVRIEPLRDRIDENLRSWKLGATLFTVFGLLALVVAGVGTYSLLAFDVAQRHFEFGIRKALGATTDKLIRAVVTHGVIVVFVGVLAGLSIALLTAPYIGPLLFATSPRDPWVYLGSSIGLLVIAVLASWIPAYRTTHVDPADALRSG